MLKFHSWPPQPGEIELTMDLGRSIPTEMAQGSLGQAKYFRQMGCVVGSLLEANMDPATPADISGAAFQIAEQYPEKFGDDHHIMRTSAIQEFLHGASTVAVQKIGAAR